MRIPTLGIGPATVALGNQFGGISLGAGSSSRTIGGTSTAFQNQILNSVGDGLSIRSSRRNAVSGNEIVGNLGYGIFADGLDSGSVLRGNTLASNAKGNVNLTRSRGLVYIS